MEKIDLILEEYKLYTEQKENFIDRNFATNRFYMLTFIAIILIMIYTNNVVFMSKITSTLLFSMIGLGVCILWWSNVDTYKTLIRIKFSNVIEKIEESLPVKLFQNEMEGIKEIRKKKIFLFSDIQKFVAIVGAIFFFSVFVSELTPIVVALINKISILLHSTRGGI